MNLKISNVLLIMFTIGPIISYWKFTEVEPSAVRTFDSYQRSKNENEWIIYFEISLQNKKIVVES